MIGGALLLTAHAESRFRSRSRAAISCVSDAVCSSGSVTPNLRAVLRMAAGARPVRLTTSSTDLDVRAISKNSRSFLSDQGLIRLHRQIDETEETDTQNRGPDGQAQI